MIFTVQLFLGDRWLDCFESTDYLFTVETLYHLHANIIGVEIRICDAIGPIATII